MAEAVTSAANTAAAAVNSTTAAVSDAATAAATSVNQAAAAMPLSAQQAADDIAAAAHAVPSATAEEKEGFFKSLTKVFTGDDSKPPPRAVDIEKELAAKIEELPKNYVLIKARAENLDKMVRCKIFLNSRLRSRDNSLSLPSRTRSKARQTLSSASPNSTPKPNSRLSSPKLLAVSSKPSSILISRSSFSQRTNSTLMPRVTPASFWKFTISMLAANTPGLAVVEVL